MNDHNKMMLEKILAAVDVHKQNHQITKEAIEVLPGMEDTILEAQRKALHDALYKIFQGEYQ